ncbi:sigma-70 family RNA polymerase sigma factor [Kitasatospora sp. NPDC005856]|uniref:RNA polymerase sigma factor n=1 Tax=Kitasatospora sp. NPDC005856 TaxID=3154566 RepID=UPI0033D11A3D
MSDNDAYDAGVSRPLLTGQGPEGLLAADRHSTREDFAEFYRRFTPTLVGFLMWQGAPTRLAADLAQETMIKAFQGWGQIRSPRSWTRKVASRELVRHVSRVEEDPVEQVPETTGLMRRCPAELAEWESRHELEELLGGLPPRQRQVLAWSVSGYSPSEIAEELGIEPAAVRANLMKARRAVALRMRAREEGA